MKSIGGFGGVKLEITIGEDVQDVTFAANKAYCKQAKRIPVLQGIVVGDGSEQQNMKGYHYEFEAFFENTEAGDETRLKKLIQIIMLSQMNGVAMKLWPKWNEEVPESEYYLVLAPERFGLSDINSKAKVGERVKGLKLVTHDISATLNCFIEGRYIPVYSTLDGEVIIFEDIAIEILKSWRN